MSLVSALGKMTRSLRAGEKTLILNQPDFASVPCTIDLSSSAFSEGEPIPIRYTVSGEDLSPPLAWQNLPAGTEELVLIIEDYDISMPKPMVHLIAYHLSPSSQELAEGALPSRNTGALDPSPKLGKNGLGFERYDGSAPPPGHGVHHYVFQLFALDRALQFDSAPGRKEMLEAIKGHVLATGHLTGTFERK
jgi:Raf kinase inhibitor-like YbhB/YbcL family protein